MFQGARPELLKFSPVLLNVSRAAGWDQKGTRIRTGTISEDHDVHTSDLPRENCKKLRKFCIFNPCRNGQVAIHSKFMQDFLDF